MKYFQYKMVFLALFPDLLSLGLSSGLYYSPCYFLMKFKMKIPEKCGKNLK